MMPSVCRVAIVCLMLLTLAAPGYPQETTGRILGALVDQTGGVLPGAKVVITSVDTGHTREVVTNNVGQYTVSLPIGNYEISFLLPNFQPFTARGISLHINDRLQVNGRLIVGAVATMTVTAERLVQPTSADRHLIQQVAIQELPLLTRSFVQLVTLVPGVSSDLREEACFCDQGNLDISINGARRSAVNWLLDGASNVNGWNNYTLVTMPSVEAIQEINVITSAYGAEWARNGGGVVNAVTKSGTNRFSGSAYHFLRNDALNANSFFRKCEPERRGQQHTTATSIQQLRVHARRARAARPQETVLLRLAGVAARQPRKANAFGTAPDPAWLTDPASPEYVPPEARDPNAVRLLTLWPAPNVAGTNNYQSTFTNELDTRQEFVRADYNVSANWSLTGRYLHDRVDSRGEYIDPAGPGARSSVPGRSSRRGGSQAGRGTVLARTGVPVVEPYAVARRSHAERDDLGITIAEVFPENAANLIPDD